MDFIRDFKIESADKDLFKNMQNGNLYEKIFDKIEENDINSRKLNTLLKNENEETIEIKETKETNEDTITETTQNT